MEPSTYSPSLSPTEEGEGEHDLWSILYDLRSGLDDLRQAVKEISAIPSDRLLTREETADRLRISVRTLDDMADAGEIQPVRIRGRVLYHPEAVDAFIQRCAGEGGR